MYFIFRDGSVVKVLGEGRFALSSNFVCVANLVMIFKPNAIIINQQLELGGQGLSIWIMRKGHTNTRFGLTAYPKKASYNRSFWRVQSD